MANSVTFVPRAYGSAAGGDLTYVERISRNRSIHILLQDTTQNSPASRGHFLLKSYREIVSRYLSLGRIEHPLPLLRELIRRFDALSRRVDCRVDDFRGLGFYVLVQDANTFYLLAGRGGRVAAGRGEQFEGLETGLVRGVQELPVELASSQKELFSTSLRDFLGLYRIDSGPEEGALTVVMGGGGGEIEAVIEAIREPGMAERLPDAGQVVLDRVNHTVMYCSFELAEATRISVPQPTRRFNRRAGRRALVASVAVVVVGLAATTVWLAPRFVGDRSETTAVASVGDEGGVAKAGSESPARLRKVSTEYEPAVVGVVVPESSAAVETAATKGDVAFALEWSQSRKRAITTTPLLDGGEVIYGSRDGYLYTVDRMTGETRWRYKASDGIGSSPVAAGDAVVAADYRGYVFSVDRRDGSLHWKRGLPAKVVSTACVGAGEVLVGCTDGVAYCLSLETGRVLWKLRTGGRIRGSAAWSPGAFFVPSYDGHLYAVSASSGKVLWKHRVGTAVSSSPAVSDGVVVVGSENNRIYGIDMSNGERRWTFNTSGPVKSFLRVDGGRVYAGCSKNVVYCLDAATGEEVWRYETGGVILSRPFVRGGVVFVTSYDRYVYCLDAATGELRDRYATDAEVFSSPVADDDHVYFGDNAGRFYCFRYRDEPAS